MLDGASIHNNSGPALCIENADKVFVTLAEKSENSLSDGANYDLSAQINGGTVLMIGSVGSTRGMDQSEQAWMTSRLQGAQGATVTLQSSNGTELASLTSTQAFSMVLVSSPQIAQGESFSIVVNGTPTQLTML